MPQPTASAEFVGTRSMLGLHALTDHFTWPKTGDGEEPVAVAGVKADLCLNWPALGTVREGWAAQASQLSVSGFSFVLVGHLEGEACHHEQRVLPDAPAPPQ